MHHSLGRNRKEALLSYFLAAVIPFGILLIVFICLGIAPFGDRSLLIWDMQIQYVDFFGWFQRVLHGEANLFYAAGKSLGGNMIGIFSYYLSSPLNLLAFFFTEETIPQLVSVLVFLKTALCGVTCMAFLRGRFSSLSRPISLSLAACYALMQYMITQSSNLMWLDGVIWLPLVMLGISRLVREGKSLLLYVSLTMSILSSWYTGYMLCLFAVLYTVYECLLSRPNGWRGQGRVLMGKFGRFGLVGLLSAGSSAVLLWPTICSLRQGKGAFSLDIFLDTGVRAPLLKMLKGFVIADFEKEKIPALYCGTFLLILFAAYFFLKAISRREKAITGAFLLTMMLSMSFLPFERIWNGLRPVFSYYCRFSFLFSFLVMVIAARAASARPQDGQAFPLAAGVVAAVGLLLDLTSPFRYPVYFYLTLALAVCYALLWRRQIRSRNSRVALRCGCLLLVCAELFVNTRSMYRRLYTYSASASSYTSYVSESRRQTDALRAADGSWYRQEKTYNRLENTNDPNYVPPATNEALSAGYAGLSHYSSAFDSMVSDLLSPLGYGRTSSGSISYREPILTSDALLGVKYVVSDSCPMGFESASDQMGETDRGNFYRNPYAMPLGYRMSDSALSDISESADPFAYQNAWISAIVGETSPCFRPLSAVSSASEDGSLSWTVEVPAGVPVYGVIRSGQSTVANLYVDGEFRRQYCHWFSDGIFSVGQFPEGRDTHIRLDGTTETQDQYEPLFYYLDMEEWGRVVDRLNGDGFQPSVFKDGHLQGEYAAADDGWLLLTVPYDDSWCLSVNGQRVQPRQAAGSLTAVPVTAGDNHIEMTYVSPGIKLGIAVSLLSIAAYVFFYICCRRRKDAADGDTV